MHQERTNVSIYEEEKISEANVSLSQSETGNFITGSRILWFRLHKAGLSETLGNMGS